MDEKRNILQGEIRYKQAHSWYKNGAEKVWFLVFDFSLFYKGGSSLGQLQYYSSRHQ